MEGEGRSKESMEGALSQESGGNGEGGLGSFVEQPHLLGKNVEEESVEEEVGGIETDLNLSGSNAADVDLIEDGGEVQDDTVKSPMDVPELLQKVLGHLCNYEDLQNIRRINRFWMENSLDLWRGEDGAALVVDRDTLDALKQALGLERAKGRSQGEPGGQDTSPSQSNSSLLLYRIDDKPFKKHVWVYDLTEYFPPELPAIQNKLLYWERCGPHLTSLEIAGVSWFKDGLLLEGLKWILASCPRLVRLKFNPHRLTKEVTQNAFEENWYENSENEDDGGDDAGEEVVEPELRENSTLAHRNIPQVMAQQMTTYNLRSLSIGSEWKRKELFQDDNPELTESFFKLVPGLKELELDSLNGVRGILEALVAGPIQLEKFTMKSFRFDDRDLWKLLHYLEDSGASSTIKELQLDIDMIEVLFESVVLRRVLRLVRKFAQKLSMSYHCTHNAYLRAKGNPFCELNLFGHHFPNLTSLTFKIDCEKPWVGWSDSESLFARFMVSLDFSIFERLENLQRFRFEYRPMRYNPSFPRRIIASEFGPEEYSSDPDESETEDCEEGAKEKEDDDDKPSYNLNLFELEGVSLDKMKEFYYEGYLSTGEILLLGKVMKNLKSFGAYLTDETFPAPFQAWPETLKKLTMINFCWLTDGVEEKVIAQHEETYPQVEIVEFAKEEDEVS